MSFHPTKNSNGASPSADQTSKWRHGEHRNLAPSQAEEMVLLPLCKEKYHSSYPNAQFQELQPIRAFDLASPRVAEQEDVNLEGRAPPYPVPENLHFRFPDGLWHPVDNRCSALSYSVAQEESLAREPSPENLDPNCHPTPQNIFHGMDTTQTATTSLFRPTAIPQLLPGAMHPFLRAYPNILTSFSISEPLFLSFIDALNIVATASPPLQIAGLAGDFISMVPHHWALIAGNAIKVSAQIGTVAASKGRIAMLMKDVNSSEGLFGSRRLRAKVVKYADLREVLGIPDYVPWISHVEDVSDEYSGFVERVLKVVGPWSTELKRDVMPIAEERMSVLDKLSAKQVVREVATVKKKAAKEKEKLLKQEEERNRKKDKTKRHGKEKDKKYGDEKGKRRGKDQDCSRKDDKKVERLMWIVVEKT